MEEETKPKKVFPKKKYVTVEEFDKMVQAIGILAEKIDTKVSVKVESVIDEAAPVGSAENPNSAIPMNPEWRKMVDEILGPDFGMDLQYSSGGDVIMFTVIVPLEKSNSKPDYKEYYKVDRRTISLNPAQTGVGVRQWCQKIKRNLSRSEQGQALI